LLHACSNTIVLLSKTFRFDSIIRSTARHLDLGENTPEMQDPNLELANVSPENPGEAEVGRKTLSLTYWLRICSLPQGTWVTRSLLLTVVDTSATPLNNRKPPHFRTRKPQITSRLELRKTQHHPLTTQKKTVKLHKTRRRLHLKVTHIAQGLQPQKPLRGHLTTVDTTAKAHKPRRRRHTRAAHIT
jgi:hypothetical protein